MITDSTILITGGAGFIGSELATVLAPHNRIVIFDNFSRDALDSVVKLYLPTKICI